jgi:TraB/PrgY/gumN family
MNPRRLAIFGLLLTVGAPSLLPASDPAQSDEMETVLVTGEQPGPGLWKVSRDGHSLWIFGTIGEVPKSLNWRTRELEARIAESQEVIYPGWPRVDLDIGVFHALSLVPAAFKAAKNPNGATLQDVLTPDTYATWIRLRKRYLKDDADIDKYRPMVAEEQLTNAIGREYRVPYPMVSADSVVHSLAKKHKVKVRTLPMVERKIKVEGARATLKAARKVDFAEGECFGRNLVRTERLIEEGRMKFDIAPVNAWAQGDLEALRPMLSVVDKDPREDCEMAALEAVMSRPSGDVPEALRTGFSLIKKQAELQVEAAAEAERNWVDAMEAALARNDATVAVIPIWLAWNPTVYVGRLRAKGYAVEEPR